MALSGAALAGPLSFRSPDDALKQGIAAFNGGYYEIALPALEALIDTKPEVARFYMARIYADNEGAYTDHVKAYTLYKQVADSLRDIDPDDDELAPVAARALTAISTYLRTGLPDANLKPNPIAADQALQRAALTFNNEDAQFELAKVFLRGEGPDVGLGSAGGDPASKIENGRHWLSRLSRAGHPGAQAFLADLMWRGKFVEKDQSNALNLIDVAVANAPAHERVWIDDIYQNIYCNAGEGVRTQATGRVAEWHERYGRRVEDRADKNGLDELSASPVRTCSNGELVRPIGAEHQAEMPAASSSVASPGMPVKTYVPAGSLQGLGTGFVPGAERP